MRLNISKYINDIICETIYSIDETDILASQNELICDSFVSDKCNLACKHCYFGITQNIKTPLSTKQWMQFINAATKSGIKHYHFSGREPLCEQRTFNVLNFLSKKSNIQYGLISNGTSVNSNIYNELLLSNINYLEISIDGSDNIRSNISFQQVHNTLNQINSKNKINTVTTIHSGNIMHFESIFDFILSANIKKLYVAPLKKIGNAYLNNIMPPSSQDYLNLIEKFYHILNSSTYSDIHIKFNLDYQYAIDALNINKFLQGKLHTLFLNKQPFYFNLHGNILELSLNIINIPYWRNIIITNDGYILPTASIISNPNYNQFSLCNIVNTSIEDILDKRRYFIRNYINNLKQYYYEKT